MYAPTLAAVCRARFTLICLLVLTVSAGWQTCCADGPDRLVETTIRQLGRVPEASLDSVVLGPDGDHVAFVLHDVGGARVVSDKEKHKVCDRASQLTFSANGRTLLYVAEKGAQVFLVRNGNFKRVHADTDTVHVSPDGRHVAYRLEGKLGYALRLDRRNGVTYEHLSGITFSADGRNVAYRARRQGKGSDRLHRGVGPGAGDYVVEQTKLDFLVLNRRELRGHERVHAFAFSPDGRHLVHWTTHNWKITLFMDNDFVKEVPLARTNVPPAVSPDNTRLVYVARFGKNLSVFCDDRPGPACLELDNLVFSPDSKRLAYRALQHNGWQIICDSDAGTLYDNVGPPVFSSKTGRLAYWARTGKESFVVCDGVEGPHYNGIDTVGFSADGKHLFYVAERAKSRLLVCDGREGPPHRRLWLPANFANARRRPRYVVHDGEKSPLKLVGVAWPTIPR